MNRVVVLLALVLVGGPVFSVQASDAELRSRFATATTGSGDPRFSQDQAGCVFDRVASKVDNVRVLGLVLAMKGQQQARPTQHL